MLRAPKFNPSFQSDADTVARFVVRVAEFDHAVERFLSPTAKPCVLIEGPRGAGKTTLCRRVLAETRRGGLEPGWIAVALGEESYGVTSPGEFFLECLFQLNDQHPDGSLDEAYRYAALAEDDVDLVRRCVAALQQYSRERHKRLLVIVENFHVLLRDQIGKPSSTLLSILRDESIFGVLATSVTHSATGVAIRASLGDFLHLSLNPLTLRECSDLWASLTPGRIVRPDRIRPLQILTGGNPRLLHILAEFMKTPSLRDLMFNLNFLIDENTEYFRNQLDVLPPIERKVFVALLDAWDPVSAKQVADVARVTTNVASAMLGRLSDRGSVIKEGTAKSTVYSASERLFNIYYLMRRRSTPSSRVRALVTFMTQYYDHDELVSTTTTLMTEACSVEPSGRADYYSTFAAIISHASAEDRLTILARTPIEFVKAFRDDQRGRRIAVEKAKPLTTALFSEVEGAIDSNDLQTAETKLGEILSLEPASAEPWMRLAMVRSWQGEDDKAVEAAQRATELEPEDGWTYAILGDVLASAGRTADAVDALQRALGLDAANGMALTTLAGIQAEEGDTDNALRLYARASSLKLLPDRYRARYAMLLLESGREREGERMLRAAARNATNNESRRALAMLLADRGRVDDAAASLETVARRSKTWEPWADLGTFLLSRTQRYGDAEAALRAATDAGADDPVVYRALGRAILAAGGDRSEVTSLAKRLPELGPGKPAYWVESGRLYLALGDVIGAERSFRSGMVLPRGEYVQLLLARVLKDEPDRVPEAEALLRDLLGTINDRRLCGPSKELAELLIHKGDDELALDLVSKAVDKNPKCYCCLVLRAEICRRKGEEDEARRSYEQALDVDGTGVDALVGLAGLSDRATADQLISKAVEAAPDDPKCLIARARNHDGEVEIKASFIRDALSADSEFVEAHILLAPLEASQGRFSEALDHFEVALGALPARRELIPEFVSATMAAARCGMTEQLKELLQDTEGVQLIEPLAVALRILSGEQPQVAREVLEVARDIVGQ